MLKGKKILITGASSGIGRQVAIDCSGNGASLVVTGRNEERLNAVVAGIAQNDQQATPLVIDLTAKGEVDQLVTQVDPLDGIVLNAGVISYTPVKFIQPDMIRNIFSVNFDANVMLIQGLLERKKIRQGASIVMIGSISAHLGIAGTALYAASKAALTAFAKVLASELAGRRIRVNIISPGLVQTDLLVKTNQVSDTENANKQQYPLGLGTVEDIASQVVFLLSDKSKWITGTDIKMDGGYTLS